MRRHAEQGAVVRTIAHLRRSEWVLCTYLAYAAILSAAVPIPRTARVEILELNLGLLLLYTLLVFRDTTEPGDPLGFVRDWLPLLVALLAYHEMGWFALPHTAHSLEASWVIWDRALLRSILRPVIESLGPLLPNILEAAYLLVYALAPFSVALLYAYRHRDRVDRFLFLFLLGVLLCYGQFPFWPSDPPRAVFPTEDLPRYITLFRRWNLWLLGKQGIHTSVFPSGHVAAAFSAAAGMWLYLPEHKWVARSLLAAAILIGIATIYGRYHYSADVCAGLAMTGLAIVVARFLDRHGEESR